MTDRTTINVPKPEHKAARKVKAEYDETWTDVLDFYAPNRGMASNGGLGQQDQPMQDVDTSDLTDEIKQEIDSMAFNGQMSDEKADDIMKKLKDLETEFKTLRERLER